MAWTTPRTWVVGELVTASMMNTHIRDNLNYLYSAANACRVSNSNQTIANTTHTALTFSTETYDTNSMHSTSSNTSRIIAPVEGKYLATARAYWTGSGGGQERQFYLKVNATTSYALVHIPPSGGINIGQLTADVLSLAVSDYVEAFVYQDSGGNLDTLGANFALVQLL